MSKVEKIGTLDLVKVDKARITKVIEIYYHWKDLNTEIQTFSGSRGINFPSELSEYMVAYVLGIHINKNGSGDAIDISDPNHPIVYEIKGSSANELSAPSSFSPSEEFDELIFARLEKKDDKYYYTEDKCKFYKTLKEGMTKTDTIYQWRRVYVRENKSNLCPTLTANMGTGGHNVPLVNTKYGIRKLTPRECFNLQGFPMWFKLPNISNTRLYKQAGNSVVVSVIVRIAEHIMNSVEEVENKRRVV